MISNIYLAFIVYKTLEVPHLILTTNFRGRCYYSLLLLMRGAERCGWLAQGYTACQRWGCVGYLLEGYYKIYEKSGEGAWKIRGGRRRNQVSYLVLLSQELYSPMADFNPLLPLLWMISVFVAYSQGPNSWAGAPHLFDARSCACAIRIHKWGIPPD